MSNASISSRVGQRLAAKLIILAVIFAVFVIGGSIIMATSVQYGDQIAINDGFQRRSFTYYEAFGIRLSATDYMDTTGSLEQMLVREKWIPQNKLTPDPADWTTVNHWIGTRHYESDAALLTSYLDMSDQTGLLQLEVWSGKFPGFASLMWSEIQLAATGNMFLLIPDIIHKMRELSRSDAGSRLEMPENPGKSVKLHTEKQQRNLAESTLNPYLIELYETASQAALDAQDIPRARFCFQQLVRLDPENQDAADQLAKLPPAPVAPASGPSAGGPSTSDLP